MSYTNFSYSFNCEKFANSLFLNPKLERNFEKVANDNIKRVLIVDDHEINIKIVKNYIKKFAPNTLFEKAKNGIEALNIVKSLNNNPINTKKIDLIITDLQMPKMNGIDFVVNVRNFDKITPIIAFTSITSKNIKNYALKNGFDDYIIKPINNNNELKKNILKWIYLKNQNERYPDLSINKAISNKTVLIADDESINNLILKKIFNKLNMKVYTVKDGIELVSKYKNQFSNQISTNYVNKYDIIISDINMPNLDGNEATKIIRNFEIVNNIKNRALIIGNSASYNKEHIFNNLKNGMDDFFKKGSNPKQIINLIQFWLFNNFYYFQENNSKDSQNCNKKLKIESNFTKNEIIELREEFIKSSFRLIKEIFRSYHNKNLENFKFLTHALKGISGNFEANKIFKIANIINDNAKKGLWPQNPNWQNLLKESFFQTITDLRNIK